MATLRQVNWLGQMRVDTSDLRAIESGVSADFDVLAGKMMTGRKPLIVRGFTINTTNASGNAADQLQLSVASGLLLHFGASESGTLFAVSDNVAAEALASTNSKVQGGFVASSINYVGLDFIRQEDAGSTDLRQFLDANTLEEIPKTVPTARTLEYRIIISTQPFSVTTNIAPIAKVETNANNNVVSVTDSRNLMFRLGSGGDAPNRYNVFTWGDIARNENSSVFEPPTSSANPFAGGDKEIVSLKQWMDAMMTRIWEVSGGEYWYSPASRDNVKLLYGSPTIGATNDNFRWTSGTSTLEWSGLKVAFENSPTYYNNIQDGSAVLNADGQCLYVDIQRGSLATLVPAIGTLTALGSPATPGTRFIVAWRQGGLVHTRDRAYEVGRTSPVATTAVKGIVRLSKAASNSLDPVVLTDTEKNSASGVAALDASKNVIAAGVSRDATLGAGSVAIGTGTNDSSVSIGKVGATTTIGGNLIVSNIDANALSIGTGSTNSLTLGRNSIDSLLYGEYVGIFGVSDADVDATTGSVNIGHGTASQVQIGRVGITTTIFGALTASAVTCSSLTTTAGDVTIPAANTFKYAAAVTDYVTITPDDLEYTKSTSFVPDYVINNTYSVVYNGFSACTRVRVPSGATITGLSLLMENNSGGNLTFGDMYCHVATYNASGAYTTSANLIANVRPTNIPNGTAWYTVGMTAGTFTVPQGGYLYVKLANDFPPGTARWLGFRALRVTYTMTQVKPVG